MDSDNKTDPDYDKPVAYDAEGRPLYAHPPSSEAAQTKEKEENQISIEAQLKHDTSKKFYPSISLGNGEYVISVVRRHPIGLIVPITLGTLVVLAVLTILFNYDLFVRTFGLTGPLSDPSVAAMPMLFVAVLAAVGTYVSCFVYTSNRFFITNESVIQEIQVGLFSRSEQTVSLENIENASYSQAGIIQQLFGYGSIRVSKNDETFYNFSFVSNPKDYLKIVNDAIEAKIDEAKNE